MLFERNVPASEVAAILVEPIQGEGGYLVPPDGFLAGLRSLCDEHGILLIFDEVQSGIGRTGKMFACEHWGVRPDIMTSAKGSAPACRSARSSRRSAEMEQWKRGAHGNTYGGNPLSCAAAIATLDLVKSEYAANAARVGDHFMQRLRELASDFPLHRRGARQGPDDRHGADRGRCRRTPARALCDRVVTRAFHNGLLLLSCGVSTVRFMPPLCVTASEVDEAVGLLRASLGEAIAGKSG